MANDNETQSSPSISPMEGSVKLIGFVVLLALLYWRWR